MWERSSSGKVGTLTFYSGGEIDDPDKMMVMKTITKYRIDNKIISFDTLSKGIVRKDNRFLQISTLEQDKLVGTVGGYSGYYTLIRKEIMEEDYECLSSSDCDNDERCIQYNCDNLNCNENEIIINHECMEEEEEERD